MNSNWTCLFLNMTSEMPQLECELTWKLPVDVASKNCVWMTSACPEVPVMSCSFDDPSLFEVIRVFSAMRLCLVL